MFCVGVLNIVFNLFFVVFCLIFRARKRIKGHEVWGWDGGKELEGSGREEVMIRIYFMKAIFSIKKE